MLSFAHYCGNSASSRPNRSSHAIDACLLTCVRAGPRGPSSGGAATQPDRRRAGAPRVEAAHQCVDAVNRCGRSVPLGPLPSSAMPQVSASHLPVPTPPDRFGSRHLHPCRVPSVASATGGTSCVPGRARMVVDPSAIHRGIRHRTCRASEGPPSARPDPVRSMERMDAWFDGDDPRDDFEASFLAGVRRLA